MTTSDPYEALAESVVGYLRPEPSLTDVARAILVNDLIPLIHRYFPEPEQPKADACEHPVHSNPGLIVPCPECGQPKADADTVRVRIALAMVDEERWNACGWNSNGDDDGVMGCAVEGLDTLDPVRQFWVVVHVKPPEPLPRAAEIAGEVEEGGDG